MIILVVEDDPQLREAVVDSLELKGHQVIATADGKQAILALQQQPDLILSDINMPEMDGLALLSHVREEHPWLPMVLMTAYGDVNQAVLAMQRGASDYLMKPFEPSELDALLQPFDVRPQGTTKSRQEEAPVCIATATRQLFQMAERVAQTDSTVLISGESGTGKEVLARYVHQHSQRHKQPFVAINCAAIPENMLEAILFGYEKVPIPALINPRQVNLNRPRVARCYWTKFLKWTLDCKPSYCEFCKSGRLSAWAAKKSLTWMYGLSPLPTATWPIMWLKANSAKTCITGSVCSRCSGCHYANGLTTSCRWLNACWRTTPIK
tara:strand:- start:1846 stop:2814 length:969 start_codon:yes stop_codon:yes gene_type:complete